jgi:hypothetical protein
LLVTELKALGHIDCGLEPRAQAGHALEHPAVSRVLAVLGDYFRATSTPATRFQAAGGDQAMVVVPLVGKGRVPIRRSVDHPKLGDVSGRVVM